MNIDNYSKTWIEMRKGNIGNISQYEIYSKYIKDLSPDAETLEIGPGDGFFSCFLRKKYLLKGTNQTMIDISPSIIKQLQLNSFFVESVLLCGDTINFLQKTKKKFDLIVLRHVMEHMERSYISNMIPLLMDRLADKGRIIVEVPNMGNIPLGIYLMYGDFSHITGFTEKSLSEAFIWNSGCDIKIQAYNLIGNIITNKGIRKMILDFVSKIIEILSVILSFLAFRSLGSYYGLNRVYTSTILLIVQKK